MPSDFPERDEHLDEFMRSLRENDGLTPCEADESLNWSARKLVHACQSRWGGAAFVGVFNDYDRARAKDSARVLRRLEQEEAINTFSCDFAVPCEDSELVRLVLAFRESPSMTKIEAVNDRVKALGGVLLSWS